LGGNKTKWIIERIKTSDSQGVLSPSGLECIRVTWAQAKASILLEEHVRIRKNAVPIRISRAEVSRDIRVRGPRHNSRSFLVLQGQPPRPPSSSLRTFSGSLRLFLVCQTLLFAHTALRD
jgi:hypothetical protein